MSFGQSGRRFARENVFRSRPPRVPVVALGFDEGLIANPDRPPLGIPQKAAVPATGGSQKNFQRTYGVAGGNTASGVVDDIAAGERRRAEQVDTQGEDGSDEGDPSGGAVRGTSNEAARRNRSALTAYSETLPRADRRTCEGRM